MSLILDALNRSRQDVDEVPGLATQHFVDRKETSDKRRYLPWAGLLLAVMVIAWLLVDREQVTQGPSQEPAVASVVASSPPVPAPVVASPATAADKPQPADPAPAVEGSAAALAPEPADSLPSEQPSLPQEVAQTNSTVADLYRRPAEPSPAPAVAASEQPAAAPAKAPGTAGEARAPSAPQPAAEKAQEQPVDIEKMVLEARQEMENARLQEHSAPFIADLSQQSKDAIPTIYYQRHDYSGTTNQSSVVLNGKQVKAGGSAAAGVKVEEILPDSVVLSYRGTQFRLRALNSWINL